MNREQSCGLAVRDINERDSGRIMEISEHREKMFRLFVFLWIMRNYERAFDEKNEIIT